MPKTDEEIIEEFDKEFVKGGQAEHPEALRLKSFLLSIIAKFREEGRTTERAIQGWINIDDVKNETRLEERKRLIGELRVEVQNLTLLLIAGKEKVEGFYKAKEFMMDILNHKLSELGKE